MAIGKKKSKSSLFALLSAGTILAVNFAAAGTTAYYATQSYTSGSNFNNSYNLRYEFDPYSKNANPADNYLNEGKIDEVKANRNKMASDFSTMYLDQGSNIVSVYPEVYEQDGRVRAFLDVVMSIEQVAEDVPGASDEEKAKKDKDKAPILTYYDNSLNSDFSIMYCDGYTVSDSEPNPFEKAKLYM